MEQYQNPSRANTNRANAALQRVESPQKTLVDNRSTMVKQRKLQKTIQRVSKIITNGKAIDNPSWDQVNDYLQDNGYHSFIGFSLDVNKENGNNVLYKTIGGTFDGAEGAKELNMKLTKKLNTELQKDASSQVSLLKKLAEIIKIAQPNLTQSEKEATGKVSNQLYYDSGLCYGFTEIYKQQPEWLTKLWESLVKWEPQGGSTEDELNNLNKHFNDITKRSQDNTSTNTGEALLLLKEAWGHMEREIGKPEYDQLPNWINSVGSQTSNTERFSIGQTTRIVNSRQDVVKLINDASPLIETQSDCIIETSTDCHSMMAYLKDKKIFFLEPQTSGATECTSWGQLGDKLWAGIDATTPGGAPLDIDVHALQDSKDNLLEKLKQESLDSFKSVNKGDDAYTFLKKYNNPLYKELKQSKSFP